MQKQPKTLFFRRPQRHLSQNPLLSKNSTPPRASCHSDGVCQFLGPVQRESPTFVSPLPHPLMSPAVAGGRVTPKSRLHLWGWTPDLLLLRPPLRCDGAVDRLPPGTCAGPCGGGATSARVFFAAPSLTLSLRVRQAPVSSH